MDAILSKIFCHVVVRKVRDIYYILIILIYLIFIFFFIEPANQVLLLRWGMLQTYLVAFIYHIYSEILSLHISYLES